MATNGRHYETSNSNTKSRQSNTLTSFYIIQLYDFSTALNIIKSSQKNSKLIFKFG